jgi:predicted HicB family RNase H-like nuclease
MRFGGSIEKGDREVVLSAAKMKDTTVSLKIEKALKAKLVAFAKAENRSLSNFIEGVLKKELASREVKHTRGRSE